MKKQIIIAAAFIAATGMTTMLYAQENLRPVLKIKTKSNIKNDRVSIITVSSSAAGCTLVLGDRAISDANAASGQAAGKRMHKPFVITKELDISSSDNTVTEVTTARDVKTGQASGKVSMSDLHFSIQSRGQAKEIEAEDGEFVIPADCPDGDCKMVVSWSWGASNGGSAKRCEKTFILTMENGVCKGISEKGIK